MAARVSGIFILAFALAVSASLVLPKASASSKPGKVTLISAKSASYNSIKLTWKKAARAQKYQVYCAASKNGKFKLVGTTSKLEFKHKKLKIGKKYFYKVRAVRGAAKGAFSKVKGATPVLGTPEAWIETYGVLCLIPNWTLVSGAQHYEVQRCSAAADSYYEQIGTTEAEAYDDYDLEMTENPPLYYYYRVRAVRRVSGKTYKSAWSNEVMSCLAPVDEELTKGIDVKLIRMSSDNVIAVVKNNNNKTVDIALKMRFFGDDKEHAAVIDEEALIDVVPGKTVYARFKPEDYEGRVNYKSYKLYKSAEAVLDYADYTDYSDKLGVSLDVTNPNLIGVTVTNNAGVDISAEAGFVIFDENDNVVDFNTDVFIMSGGESATEQLSIIDLGGKDYARIEPVIFRAGKMY